VNVEVIGDFLLVHFDQVQDGQESSHYFRLSDVSIISYKSIPNTNGQQHAYGRRQSTPMFGTLVHTVEIKTVRGEGLIVNCAISSDANKIIEGILGIESPKRGRKKSRMTETDGDAVEKEGAAA